jgi:peroxiredoxin
MAIESTMLALGTKAPDFSLQEVTSGERVNLGDLADKKALLVMFICRHCPYVKHIEREIAALGRDYQNKDLGIVAISANDPDAYTEDAPESLAIQAKELGFTFPYLFDETQSVAKAYTAACTPDFFLFDSNRELVYRGQFDNSRPKNDFPVNGEDLRAAIEALLNDRRVNPDQKPSLGCSIKFRPGNEPDYLH